MSSSTATSSAWPPCAAMAGLICSSITCITRSGTAPDSWAGGAPPIVGDGVFGLSSSRPPCMRSLDQSMVAPLTRGTSAAGTTMASPPLCCTESPGRARSTGLSDMLEVHSPPDAPVPPAPAGAGPPEPHRLPLGVGHARSELEHLGERLLGDRHRGLGGWRGHRE